jgi:hypothetical protein
MTNPEQFKLNSYVDIKGLIPKDICRIITEYALLQEKTNFTPEPPPAQVINAHSVYSDTLMETMMQFMLPHMEKNTGLELFPTYSYFRVYHPGMELARHKDRPSCEISTTICFGHNYIGTDQDYNWGMYVDKHSVKTLLAPDGDFVSSNNPGVLLHQNPGDCIVYRGCDVEHWREPFNASPGSYQVQAFFHYIDKNGPYYPEFAYDRRPGIGFRTTKGINN